MTMHENVSGTWKNIVDAYENVSATWKRLLEGYENVGGVWKKFYTGGVLLQSFTVTVSTVGSLHGYNRNADLATNFGNIAGGVGPGPGQFNDASAVLRQITAIVDGDGTAGSPSGDISLCLDGTSLADADTVFKFITINGVQYMRSARTAYAADTGAANDTRWAWSNGDGTNVFGADAGSIIVEIWG